MSAVCSVILALLVPPRISLNSDEPFRSDHSLGASRICTVATVAQNRGFLPIWYRQEMREPPTIEKHGLGVSLNITTGKLDYSEARWAPWTALWPGQSVRIDQIIQEHDAPGIQLKTWFGRRHNVFDKSAWSMPRLRRNAR